MENGIAGNAQRPAIAFAAGSGLAILRAGGSCDSTCRARRVAGMAWSEGCLGPARARPGSLLPLRALRRPDDGTGNDRIWTAARHALVARGIASDSGDFISRAAGLSGGDSEPGASWSTITGLPGGFLYSGAWLGACRGDRGVRGRADRRLGLASQGAWSVVVFVGRCKHR